MPCLIKLFAWGEGESGGHVVRETTSRGLCGLGCPSHVVGVCLLLEYLLKISLFITAVSSPPPWGGGTYSLLGPPPEGSHKRRRQEAPKTTYAPPKGGIIMNEQYSGALKQYSG